MLADEIAFTFPVDPRQMDRAFAFDESNNLRHGVFRWNRNHHVHAIGHQMPFLNLRFLLCGKLMEDLAEAPTKFKIKRLAS